jgi:hypothetical protein
MKTAQFIQTNALTEEGKLSGKRTSRNKNSTDSMSDQFETDFHFLTIAAIFEVFITDFIYLQLLPKFKSSFASF